MTPKLQPKEIMHYAMKTFLVCECGKKLKFSKEATVLAGNTLRLYCDCGTVHVKPWRKF